MGVEDSYIMRKVKGFKVGDRFTMDSGEEAYEQAAFLERWGFSCNIVDTTVIITVSGWGV